MFSTLDNVPEFFLLKKSFHLHNPIRVMQAIRKVFNNRAWTHNATNVRVQQMWEYNEHVAVQQMRRVQQMQKGVQQMWLQV